MTTTDKNCPDPEVLEQLLLGRVPSEEAVDLEDHLAVCEQCAERAGAINSEDELIVAMQAKQLPPEDDGRVSALIDQLREVSAEAQTSRLGETQAGAGQPAVAALDELSELLDPPVEADEIGRIGQYHVLDVLGAGGMGLVLRARDPQLKRTVAIKVMKGDVANDESAKSRFLREAQATAAIEHDNIVTIYQVAEHRGLPYYAMQFLRGESLEDRLKREGNLDQGEVLRIGREVAEGLAAAHAEGLLHRDIKPDNIWLEEKTGRAKIVDFGLARDTKDEENITLSGMLLGTPRYMAPEQALGKAVDHRCDLFSLGSVLYHLATGQPPFAADNLAATLMAVVNKQPQSITELHPEVDAELVHLIDRLLEKEPSSRFQSAIEVVDAIRTIEQTLADPERHQRQEVRSEPTFGELHFQQQRRRGVVIGATVGTLMLAIVFGIIFVIQTQTGLVRVEVNDDDLEVLLDEQKITVTDRKWNGRKKAAKHQLAIKLGDQTLNIGKATVFEVDGRDVEHHVTVKLNGFDITSNEFEVARGDKTALTISVETRTVTEASDDVSEVTTARGVWSEPVNLGPVVNSKEREHEPFLSADGLTLWFDSDREGGLGSSDLWMCERSSTSESWSAPVNLGPRINSERIESSPCLSSDGLTLLFSSDRAGGYGKHDIWMSSRKTARDSWSEPVNIGPNINDRRIDAAPVLSADGLTLLYSTWLSLQREMEIWISTRESASQPWSRRRSLGFVINTSADEGGPCLSADGGMLLFSSNRMGSQEGSYDLLMSSRKSPTEAWSEPVNLGPRINSVHGEGGATLSSDGRTLIFESDRPGGTGGLDLWMSTRLDPPLAKAPFEEPEAKAHQQAWADYMGLPVEKIVELPGSEKLSFMLIPPGEFLMGSSAEDLEQFMKMARADNDEYALKGIPREAPQHPVRITQPFYLGKYELTQAQWEALMDSNPSNFVDPLHPVEQVTWEDSQRFLSKLNQVVQRPGLIFVLPTEAQWEYACRAGTTSFWSSGNDETLQREYGWSNRNSDGTTHPVGQLFANGFGLHDMHGNAWEFCADWFASDYYKHSPTTDPTGPPTGTVRVCRGGRWSNQVWRCRSAFRWMQAPDVTEATTSVRLAMMIDSAQLNNPPPQSAVANAEPKQAITRDDGWIDLLALTNPSQDGPGHEWRLSDNELSGEGHCRFPVIPNGNFEYETEFTVGEGHRFVLIGILDALGNIYAEVIGFPGLVVSQPANSTNRIRVLRKAAAASAGERHRLTVTRTSENDETVIVITLDGQRWVDWKGTPDALSSRNDNYPYAAVTSKSRTMTVHTFRFRMLDGEAKLLRPWEAWKAGLAPSPTEILTSPDWEWTEPKPIAEVNSEAVESGPTISSDRLTMVFASRRARKDADLWISERSYSDEVWGEPRRLDENVNGGGEDAHPELSADGLTLLFVRNPNGPRNGDIFMTTRPDRASPWTDAIKLGEYDGKGGTSVTRGRWIDVDIRQHAPRQCEPGSVDQPPRLGRCVVGRAGSSRFAFQHKRQREGLQPVVRWPDDAICLVGPRHCDP